MFGPLRFEPPGSYCKSGVPSGQTLERMLPNFVHTGATLCTPMPHVSNIRLRSRRARHEARLGLWPLAAPRLGCGAFARPRLRFGTRHEGPGAKGPGDVENPTAARAFRRTAEGLLSGARSSPLPSIFLKLLGEPGPWARGPLEAGWVSLRKPGPASG